MKAKKASKKKESRAAYRSYVEGSGEDRTGTESPCQNWRRSKKWSK